MDASLIDILWILICAALVFIMQAGFMCLESGLTRSKNSINVAAKNLADFVFSVCGFWAVGYGLMFGAEYAGLIGTDSFFANLESTPYMVAFFVFQAMFCGTATTIFSGAIAERMSFSGYLMIAGILAVFVYPVFGNWAWNGLETGKLAGWLGAKGFVDFAGSTVVHSVGGWVALAALLVVGPRRGRFVDGVAQEVNASNLPMSVLGTLLLWFGWFGFNGGSTLAMNGTVPTIIVNTLLAGGAGSVVSLLVGWFECRTPKISYMINGCLGGLVAITANCHVVSALDAVIIGSAAGPICIWAEKTLERFQIDDAVGAVPVHLACGIWGTLAVALFGDTALIGTGLSMLEQLEVQALGIFAAFVIAFVIPYILIKIINRFIPLRVSKEDEEVGLNISEHNARTDLLDLFAAMEVQADTQNISLRLPVEPFTEVGRIARCYNLVMDALEESVSKTEAVIKSATDGIITFSRDGFSILHANPRAIEMFALPGGEALSSVQFTDLVSGDDSISRGRVSESFFNSQLLELSGNSADGSTFPVETVITPAKDMPFYVAIIRDITDRKAAELEICTQQAYFRQLFESSPQAIVLINTDGKIKDVNKGFEDLFGASRELVLGFLNRSIVVPDHLQQEAAQFNETVLSGRPVDKETFRKHKDGRLIPIHVLGYPIEVNGEISGIYYIYNDITERKEFENQLAHQAFHDALTALPNRVLFTERLNRAIKRSKRKSDHNFAAMMLDLDRFKWINDSLGHLAGDNFLVAIAKRLKSCIREVDTVARLGGDEFGIVIEDYGSSREIIEVAKRIENALEQPMLLDGTTVTSSASIGIVLTTKDYTDSEDIMRDADIAMYRSKELGRARFKVFNNRMHEQVLNEVELEKDLRKAIEEEALSLHYQPIVVAETGRLTGFEALLRWDCPERGMVSPDVVIPLAEETGLIAPIGKWVLQNACSRMSSWVKETGEPDLTVSVNLSFKQLSQSDFVSFVEKTLYDSGLPAKNLKLELTESCLMQNPEETIPKLTELRALGVRLIIDDFGTGYSSLNYLQSFPIDGLKIDRSFISADKAGENNVEIVRTIVNMAKSLNVGVVAEGVEESGQLEMLKGMSCDEIQGFLFSKPVSEDDVHSLILSLKKDEK
ncbi:ammonium transporter [Maridesulfovibrio frigidus]|uniref:ammonium transporter n=1 Tax=Maridesulfovibrio frigidus TaxID=340956 RepID=UPI0004E20F9A|nr:ammonium transporter [Maridesulfovibrio frigidus]